MGVWWNQPPDFANSVYEEPDALLGEKVAELPARSTLVDRWRIRD